MEIKIGTESEKQIIMAKYPGTVQVMNGDGYLIIAHEQNEILGFAFVFRRKIPAPVGEKTEDFINIIDVFNQKNRNKGIGSAIIEKCIDTAKQNGSYQIRAYCDINNISSHMLWVKMKFGISPVKTSDGTICGSYVTYIL